MRRAVVRIQHASLNRQWINQDTGPFFLRNMLEDADLPFVRKIPTRIMFPLNVRERSQLAEWGCYEQSCAARFPPGTVGVHLWSQGSGWSAPAAAAAAQAQAQPGGAGGPHGPQSGRPHLQRMLARVLEHNLRLTTNGTGSQRRLGRSMMSH
eukprot:COSAG01_NODE_24711_length_769_cov_2.144776_2_plen_152_part_00